MLIREGHHLIFASTHFWHARWDHEQFFNMSIPEPSELSNKNIMEVTEDDLKEDQKSDLARVMEEYKLVYLRSYSLTKRGEAIKKHDFLVPRHISIDENPGK